MTSASSSGGWPEAGCPEESALLRPQQARWRSAPILQVWKLRLQVVGGPNLNPPLVWIVTCGGTLGDTNKPGQARAGSRAAGKAPAGAQVPGAAPGVVRDHGSRSISTTSIRAKATHIRKLKSRGPSGLSWAPRAWPDREAVQECLGPILA